MTMQPTYTAKQVKHLCMTLEMDHDAFKVLVDVIEEEMDLYTEEDLVILLQASMIFFTRSLLQLSLKSLR